MFWHRLPIVQAADADARSSSGALSCLVLALCIYPQSPREGLNDVRYLRFMRDAAGFLAVQQERAGFVPNRNNEWFARAKLSELVLI